MTHNRQNDYTGTTMDRSKEEMQRLNRLNNMEDTAALFDYDSETGDISSKANMSETGSYGKNKNNKSSNKQDNQ